MGHSLLEVDLLSVLRLEKGVEVFLVFLHPDLSKNFFIESEEVPPDVLPACREVEGIRNGTRP